ncbi:leucyl aminopeptidase [Patescibacteria group bacterium]|nr:leucyl aminopeptidase [Patescibacteria group bacterium]
MELVFSQLEDKQAEILFFPVLTAKGQAEKLISSLAYDDEKSILKRLKRENFTAELGQSFVIHDDNQSVVILGTGQEKKLSPLEWRELAGNIIIYLRQYSAQKVGLDVKYWLKGTGDAARLAQSIAEGLYLANYEFVKYKKNDKSKIKVDIKELYIYSAEKQAYKFRAGFEIGRLMAQGTAKGRDLVNEPAGHMTPNFLAEEALSIAKNNKNITVKVFDKEKISQLKMDAFLGISKGSSQPPKFIHLIYKPKGRAKDKIALVGKGLTFDSGGLNVKPWEGMQQMKIDMGGAAAVLGVFSVIDKLQPKVEVHGIIAACENMSSGSAIKPGDVVANMQGKTIEIGHTDAEGRVTLADSLAYAQKQDIKKIVDIATLTGAIMFALGPQYGGLFSSDDKLSKDLLRSANLAGESLWQMPLAPEYKDFNESKIADIKNIGTTRLGGSILAAWFLKYFVEDDVAWAHIDIAAPAYAEKPFNSYVPTGGVGFGVRTFLEWLNYI